MPFLRAWYLVQPCDGSLILNDIHYKAHFAVWSEFLEGRERFRLFLGQYLQWIGGFLYLETVSVYLLSLSWFFKSVYFIINFLICCKIIEKEIKKKRNKNGGSTKTGECGFYPKTVFTFDHKAFGNANGGQCLEIARICNTTAPLAGNDARSPRRDANGKVTRENE